MSPPAAPTPPPSRRGQRGGARMVAGRRRRERSGLITSAFSQESRYHFHQFSGSHGVSWCWTEDRPVELCLIPGPVVVDGAGLFDPGAER